MTTDASTMDHALQPVPEFEPFDASSGSPFDLLRDRNSLFDDIGSGDDLRRIALRCLFTAVAGSAVFGLSLGAYAGSAGQVLASLLKMPILLLGTSLLTFPTFFVLQSWRAPRSLDWRRAIALLCSMLGATGLVWGALAPPVLFLVISTRHYQLAQFLAVAVGAFGGLVGCSHCWVATVGCAIPAPACYAASFWPSTSASSAWSAPSWPGCFGPTWARPPCHFSSFARPLPPTRATFSPSC
ncbi:MAG: hypothetical protein MPN21_08630 [Thermoanaerobaculia bacterium]|nr:hypothetical protein [Thermoanaerobaculia bacterium]